MRQFFRVEELGLVDSALEGADVSLAALNERKAFVAKAIAAS